MLCKCFSFLVLLFKIVHQEILVSFRHKFFEDFEKQLQNDFSGYDSTRVKYIGNYTQNNKQYKDVIIVFEDNGFNEIYFSKYAGVIKLFNPNTNEGIELY